MTIPLREGRGEEVGDSELEESGPQHIAPMVAWLATQEAAGITSEIFHTGYGGVAIMQQPAVIKQFKKATGVWNLEELDEVVPLLMAAKKENVEAAKTAGVAIEV